MILGLLMIMPSTHGVAEQPSAAEEAGAAEAAELEESAPGGVYVIPIHGDIQPSQVAFLQRSISTARSENASRIVFEIDTFGGRVDSALRIANLIGSLDDMHTIAYVALSPEGTGVSWSAGALIAFATDGIYMAPGTSIGAAAPVLASPDGQMAAADEKVVSAMRGQMAALAEKNGYPVPIALAMVDDELVVYEYFLNGEQGIATASEFESLEREHGEALSRGATISEQGKLLTLTAGEMERYGVSRGTAARIAEVAAKEGLERAPIVRLEPTGADQLVAILTGAAFSSLLILVGLIALFSEISSPGFGIPGTIAAICFATLFTTNFLLGTVGSVELLLFLVGVILLVVEILVLPGFGVAGISGLVTIALSLILSMQEFVIPTFDWEWEMLHRNVLVVLGNVLGAVIGFMVVASMFRHVSFFRRLSLATTQDVSEGYTVQAAELYGGYIGRRGTALTTLRPSGKADIDGEPYSVESDGEYIEAGTPLEVIDVRGSNLIVRKI